MGANESQLLSSFSFNELSYIFELFGGLEGYTLFHNKLINENNAYRLASA